MNTTTGKDLRILNASAKDRVLAIKTSDPPNPPTCGGYLKLRVQGNEWRAIIDSIGR